MLTIEMAVIAPTSGKKPWRAIIAGRSKKLPHAGCEQLTRIIRWDY